MRIAITGAHGFIGSRLVRDLRADGHEAVVMVRREARAGEISWRPGEVLDPKALQGVDGVIHLAGESIGSGRWTPARKQRILNSRRLGTQTIAEALAKVQAEEGPKVMLCASAVGYYGERGDEVLTEDSPPGDDFLARVVIEWEAACQAARDAGVRVINTRFGVNVDPHSPAMRKMLPLFKLGLGGRLGSGKQWWPWISLTDLSRAVRWALEQPSAGGPYNVTSPNPLTNAEFTKIVAQVLHRPAFLPVPAFAPRLVLGELADALLFTSIRARPARLLEGGFTFEHEDLGEALRAEL